MSTPIGASTTRSAPMAPKTIPTSDSSAPAFSSVSKIVLPLFIWVPHSLNLDMPLDIEITSVDGSSEAYSILTQKLWEFNSETFRNIAQAVPTSHKIIFLMQGKRFNETNLTFFELSSWESLSTAHVCLIKNLPPKE